MPLELPRGGLRACLIAGCAAGLGLVAAAPWASHRGWGVASILYAIFDPVCHQIVERSFRLWGEPLAVCHRCTGLYLGFALGIACWPVFPAAAARLLARPRWIAAFATPLAVDAVLLANSPLSRLGTGLLAAFPVALLALVAASQLLGKVLPGILPSNRPLAPPPARGIGRFGGTLLTSTASTASAATNRSHPSAVAPGGCP